MTSRYEQETVLSWNEDEPLASIYTASPKSWRKCQRLGLKLERVDKDTAGNEIGWLFSLPVRDLRWGKKREMSDEERAKRAARLRDLAVLRTGGTGFDGSNDPT